MVVQRMKKHIRFIRAAACLALLASCTPQATPPTNGPKYWSACVVRYRLTVARNGALIRYKLFGCDNPYLDSATIADILRAAPYPVPPNFSGTEYNVYGSKVYNKRPG